MVLLLISGLLITAFGVINPVSAVTIRVPEDYPTIQEAITAATSGDTIIIANGTYHERIVITKTLTIIGENAEGTKIDGSRAGIVVDIRANNLILNSLTIQNGGFYDGIWIGAIPTSGVRITNCIIKNNAMGIGIQWSSGNIITNNLIQNNTYGIRTYQCTGSTFMLNTIRDSRNYGLYIASSSNNYFYRNNIITNANQAYQDGTSTNNHWDNGAEGNYWSDYAGQDLNGDGIGDTLIPHQGLDYKPLMTPWSSTRIFNVTFAELTYRVLMHTNSSIAGFFFDKLTNRTTFKVTGALGTVGFTNVTIPKILLYGPWTVTVDGLLSKTITENTTHTFIYILYKHFTQTTLEVTITGSRACKVAGDCNGDGAVNIKDANILLVAWLSKVGEPRYDWQADINVDGAVNIKDVNIIGIHWLEIDP